LCLTNQTRYTPRFFRGALPLQLACPRFFESEEDFLNFQRRLKLTPCPFCKICGALILHGRLYGYAENDDCRKICRGRRILCNNRKQRHPGCGHSFSVLAAATLRRFRLSALNFWVFLKSTLRLDNKAQALRDLKVDLSVSSAYRLWKRFTERQSHLRSALANLCAPPSLPYSRQPAEQTLAHLEAAFPHAACPIVAFQQQLQRAFL
jgi:hypothetical protein